jgi:hypothetical protein
LPGREVALEGGVLHEVADDHVPAAAGETAPTDRLGGELGRQPVVQPVERVEAVEHLPVAAGVRAAAFDDVAAVLAAFAGGPQELVALGQRPFQLVTERDGGFARQAHRLAVDLEQDGLAVAPGIDVGRPDAPLVGLSSVPGTGIRLAGEFLDQQHRGCFLYPPSSAWNAVSSQS